MPTVYGYARASTIEQEVTLRDQAEKCENEYRHRFKDKGYAWGGVFTDAGESGDKRLQQRPAGYKLLLELKPGDVIIFTKLDRGFRNTRDFLEQVELWRHGEIGLRMLDLDVDTTSAVGKMIAGIMALIAEFERCRAVERIRDAMDKLAREGRAINQHPGYGFKFIADRHGKKYRHPDPVLRQLGSQFLEWQEEGWPVEKIYWHVRKFPAHLRAGRNWGPTSIQRAIDGEKRLRASEQTQPKESPS